MPSNKRRWIFEQIKKSSVFHPKLDRFVATQRRSELSSVEMKNSTTAILAAYHRDSSVPFWRLAPRPSPIEPAWKAVNVRVLL
jgi:hypothetical protein